MPPQTELFLNDAKTGPQGLAQFPEISIINNKSVLRILTCRMYRHTIVNYHSYETAQNHVFVPISPTNIARKSMPVFHTSPWARNYVSKIKHNNPLGAKTGRCRYCPGTRAQTRCWRVLFDSKDPPPLNLVFEGGTRRDHRSPRKPVGIADTRVAWTSVKYGRCNTSTSCCAFCRTPGKTYGLQPQVLLYVLLHIYSCTQYTY